MCNNAETMQFMSLDITLCIQPPDHLKHSKGGVLYIYICKLIWIPRCLNKMLVVCFGPNASFFKQPPPFTFNIFIIIMYHFNLMWFQTHFRILTYSLHRQRSLNQSCIIPSSPFKFHHSGGKHSCISWWTDADDLDVLTVTQHAPYYHLDIE